MDNETQAIVWTTKSGPQLETIDNTAGGGSRNLEDQQTKERKPSYEISE
jgi:hypothetical protein